MYVSDRLKSNIKLKLVRQEFGKEQSVHIIVETPYDNKRETIEDLIVRISDGNPGALTMILENLIDSEYFNYILLCEKLNITGSKLFMLYKDCCNSDKEKFIRTVKMIIAGVFTEEQIQNNFELLYAIPFIDESIPMPKESNNSKYFGPGHENWDEYCNKQRDSFDSRLEEFIEHRKRI